MKFNWGIGKMYATRFELIKTSDGPGHFLSRRRSHGDHEDGTYGWSRDAKLCLRLSHLEGGHFEAFRFKSNLMSIARTVQKLLLY